MAAKKKKKAAEAEAPKAEFDAVKWFIGLMLFLIAALGVYLFVQNSNLGQRETDLANARKFVHRVRKRSLDLQAYLNLIGASQETVLMSSPIQFFSGIYRPLGIPEKDYTFNPVHHQPNPRQRYVEYYWDLDFRNVTREQVSHFMYEVQKRSPKAKIIESTLRRTDRKHGGDIWRAHVRVGYRVAMGH